MVKATIPRGIYNPAVTNIPDQWSKSWFRSFISNHLQNADTRNAISGPGISITGGILTPATISAKQLITSPFSVLGNPGAVTGPAVDISATANGQVLQLSGDQLIFGTLELADNIGLGPSFTVADLNTGSVLQALGPTTAAFSAVTLPLSDAQGDLWYAATANAIVALPIGTANQILGITSGLLPAWETIAGTTGEIDVSFTSGITISIDSAYVGQSSITTLGTITTGVWEGTPIGVAYGGVPSTSGVTNGWVLTNDLGTPTWEAASGGGNITLTLPPATFVSTTALIASAAQDAYIYCPAACTITGVVILTVGGPGNCEVGVSKAAYGSFPPVWPTNNITASDTPTVTSGISDLDTTLTGWTTSVSAGDVIGFHLVSSSNFTKITIQLFISQAA